MKNALSNHKSQAFYISFLFFLPLAFLLFNSTNFFKIEFRSEDSFTLAMKQFTQNQPTQTPPIPTNSEPIQHHKPKPIKQPIKKTKKAAENQVKPIQAINPIQKSTPSIAQTPTTHNQALKNSDAKPTQLTYGKDNHPALEKIQKAIMEQARKNYPRQARKMRMQGVVEVEFLWKENKSLAELKIIQNSGHNLLDKSALESIRKASAFFPYYQSDLRIVLPIVYNLKA
ncbi:energy transducer TonB [Campylobacter jejuni]|nr:energy transducer TonB [Campylobacter jejuni]